MSRTARRKPATRTPARRRSRHGRPLAALRARLRRALLLLLLGVVLAYPGALAADALLAALQ